MIALKTFLLRLCSIVIIVVVVGVCESCCKLIKCRVSHFVVIFTVLFLLILSMRGMVNSSMEQYRIEHNYCTMLAEFDGNEHFMVKVYTVRIFWGGSTFRIQNLWNFSGNLLFSSI